MGSLRPVFPVCAMASRAFPAGVVRINHNYWNARLPRLVFNIRPDLVERPGVMDIPLGPSNRCPHPYATQILDGNCGRGAFFRSHGDDQGNCTEIQDGIGHLISKNLRRKDDVGHRMRRYFEFIVAQEDTMYHKPDPEPVPLAMKRWG